MIRHLHVLTWCLVVWCFGTFGLAQEAVPLLRDAESAEVWKSYNGQEFPGATVKLTVDNDVKHNNLPSLRIDGDFTKGGNYVEASVAVDADVGTLSFWIKYPETEQISIRLIDGTKQCHQIVLAIKKSDDWQHVSFPAKDFFAKRGQPDAPQGVNKYESWGGAADGKWHAPAASFHVLIGKRENRMTPTLWLSDVKVSTQAEASGSASVNVPLEEVVEGEPGWNFSLGEEFKGAKGALTVEKDQPEPGQSALKLSADFTGGGAYVETGKDLKPLGLLDLNAVKLRVKSENVTQVTVRMIDGTGQVHQAKNIKINADGKWNELSIKPSQVVGGEHWNGANDGKWHGAPQYVSIIVGANSAEDKKPVILVAGGVADATVPAKASAAAYTETFENELKGWDFANASIDKTDAFKSKQSLVLKKTEDALSAKVSAVGPAFAVAAGQWQIKFSAKSDLTSMDNSYAGGLYLDLLDAGGAPIKSVELVNLFKKNAWKPLAKQVEIPAGVSQARFRASINKETPGSFWIDELSASAMIAVAKDERIKRLMFTTSQLGNLLFPNDSREVTLTVLADKPVPETQRKVRVVVKDYWGAEQNEPMEVTLERGKKVGNFLSYEGKLDLSKAPLQVGRYYELHGQIDRGENEPFRNYTSLAILPEAPANAFKPEEIPFTSRNWDNRIEAYVRLTHRLGVRICGVWGGWKAEPPYENNAPQLKLIQELGMGWLTGIPTGQIEQRAKGWEKYDEKALREGVRKFIADYGHVRPMIISLGNEPHDKGDATKIPIEGYRIIYDEVKKIDPSIKVVGTSVGVVEDWFKNGFGQWCDVYDFHVYEDALGVRKILEQRYPEMFKKYGHAKPVWSTELGLNSQGLARQTVASEVHKKFTNFFAGGGENVSWFGLLYPDGDGSNHDSFGSAHNVFDCRYNKYAPKLDAIAYYYSVNTILNKKFVEDKVYNENAHAFLFRNAAGDSLQVLYKDKGRDDAFVPLEGVSDVTVTRLDGQIRTFDAGGRGITLSITEDPVLLTYKGGPGKLPDSLGKPAIALASAPASIVRTEKSVIEVTVNDGAADRVSLAAQPFWTVQKEATGNNNARFVLVAPAETNIRELDTSITLTGASGKPVGEIYYRPAVTGTMSIELIPVPFAADKPAAVKLVIRNNSPSKQDVAWDITLTGEQQVKDGQYGEIIPAAAYFADTPSGVASIEGKQQAELVIPLAEAQKTVIYRVKATAKDSTGRVLIDERPMAGFVAVPKAGAITLDGKLNEPVWQRAPSQLADQAPQFYAFGKGENKADWKDAKDLSADIKFAWDEQNLYLGIAVTDDIAGPVKPDYDVWQQDGLQMLIDPMRTSNQKVGKYDYAVGENAGNHRVKCYLAADGSVQLGDVTTWKVSTSRGEAGNIVYEIAIPWGNVLPFKPALGANLGLTLIMNEDDGAGRDAFMTWFGNAHNKDVDKVGDLILVE